jgi:glycerol-3-phosphate acyltransferase PlsX
MGRACTVAVDAMGGDRAPGEIVAGALLAAEELDVGVLLVGQPDAIVPLLPAGDPPEGVEVLAASEVVAMHDDPAASVRTKKDSSLVRAAEAVRDGRAQAMVGAGNTGATMASALLRCGRIKGVARPGIAVPIPVLGSHTQILIDGGATVDCDPEWLLQFARMGSEYAQARYHIDAPTIGLLSNGEEAGKGDVLRKRASSLLESLPGFVGNVEGRDLMAERPDVVVTDGFTGNVALKTLEGALRQVAGLVFGVLESTPDARVAGAVVGPLLLDAAAELDPDATGGAVLLGIDGVCVISHGSSSARAIVNAIKVAAECVETDVVGRIRGVVSAASTSAATGAVTDAG